MQKKPIQKISFKKINKGTLSIKYHIWNRYLIEMNRNVSENPVQFSWNLLVEKTISIRIENLGVLLIKYKTLKVCTQKFYISN